MLSGLVIVVVLGLFFSIFVATPESLATNSQVLGRTSPSLMDLVAALATGFAGGFAMCRKDLSAVLPGVAIAISLVPPLGVVGVLRGSGSVEDALGALILFLSNVVALVIAGSIVFTMGGYARDPGSSPIANRRRAYIVVTVLAIIVAVPLAANSIVSIAIARWSVRSSRRRSTWLEDEHGRAGVRRRLERADGDAGRHDRRRIECRRSRTTGSTLATASRATSVSSSTSVRASSTSSSERSRALSRR